MSNMRLSPDALLSSSNITGTIVDIQDDPDSPDSNWITATDTTLNTYIQVSFPTSGLLTVGADLQEFRMLVRKTSSGGNDPSFYIYLYENGTALADSTATPYYVGDTATIYSFKWDANLLTDKTGAGVEIRLEGYAQSGGPSTKRSVEYGAVEWNATVDLAMATLSSSSTVSATGTVPISGVNGTGTASDPYQITTYTDLTKMSKDASGHWTLMNDIDASESSTTNWTSFDFSGGFDGKGYKISNLVVASGGFFRNADLGHYIKNVGLENIHVKAHDGGFVGSLARRTSETMIDNCWATGRIDAHAESMTTVWAGGFVAENFTGLDKFDWIKNCFTQVNAYVTRYIDAASADLNGIAYAGGFIRTARGDFRNCYSTGVVSADNGIGGFAFAVDGATNYDCFWDTETSGTTTSALGTGKLTSEMKTQSTYTNWIFDWKWVLDALVNNGYPHLVNRGSGTSTDPYKVSSLDLLNKMRNSSVNVAGNHFKLMNDIDATDTINWNSGVGWSPISLYANVDGNGKKISKLFINSTGSIKGLFGTVYNCTIKNLGLEDVNITGYTYVGGLLGDTQEATVDNCYTTGYVASNHTGTSSLAIGGIAGSMTYLTGSLGEYVRGSSISNSYSKCTVESVKTDTSTSFHQGGVSGVMYGEFYNKMNIKNCYFAGIIKSAVTHTSINGFAGAASETNATDNFFDYQTATISTDPIATAKTTTEMQTQSTFTNWDFTNIWEMVDYPKLKIFPTATGSILGSATLASLSTITASPTVNSVHQGSATLDTSSTLTGSGVSTYAVSATLATSSTATANATINTLHQGSATLATASTTTATGDVATSSTVHNASSTLSTTSTAIARSAVSSVVVMAISSTGGLTFPNQIEESTGSVSLSIGSYSASTNGTITVSGTIIVVKPTGLQVGALTEDHNF